MIKILFHIETLQAGGAEKVLCNLVNSMDQKKFDITVVTLFPVEADKFLAPGIHYYSLYPKAGAVYRYLYRLEAALGLVCRRIRGKFDIEVAYLECGPTKVMASSANKDVLKLAWVHCDLTKKMQDIDTFVKKSRGWYEKFDKVICVADSVRKSFEKLYGTQIPTAVLYNVNDEQEILDKAQAFSVPRDRRITLAAVGRLSPEKGVDRLLNACGRLREEGNDFTIQLVGDGPERGALTTAASSLGLNDQIAFLGFQGNPYPYMAAADLIVCPSRYEGFSTVVTEALILGKPVVTTDCSGMDELLGDSEYGLITENSEDGLYLGLKRMLTEPGLLEHYAAQAKRRGRDFRKEQLVRATEDFFIIELEGKRK